MPVSLLVTILGTAAAVAFGCILYRGIGVGQQRLPSFPGPKADPLIGHVRAMPTEYEWKTFTEWKAKYGQNLLRSLSCTEAKFTSSIHRRCDSGQRV